MSKFISGGYSVGVPPLPIPNREVKPVRADGTASSGRVGRRHFSERFFKVLKDLFFYFLRANFVGSYKLSIFASVMPNYLIVPVCWRKILLLE